jgi:hypothetical protein
VSSNFPAMTLARKMASWKTRTFAFYFGFFGLKFMDFKQSRASFVECLKLSKAIKVVEKVLKTFLK